MKVTINYKTYGDKCCAWTDYDGTYYPAMGATWAEAREKLLIIVEDLRRCPKPPPPEVVDLDEVEAAV